MNKNVTDVDEKNNVSNKYIKKAIDSLFDILNVSKRDDSVRNAICLVTENHEDQCNRYIAVSNGSRSDYMVLLSEMMNRLNKQEVLDLFADFLKNNQDEIRSLMEENNLDIPDIICDSLDESQ